MILFSIQKLLVNVPLTQFQLFTQRCFLYLVSNSRTKTCTQSSSESPCIWRKVRDYGLEVRVFIMYFTTNK